jgi:RNA polymerase sigma-70 factor, ECF subfamily
MAGVLDPLDELTVLAERIRSGEMNAERELVERFSRGVRTILRHAANDAGVVDDLHQETFRIALERIRGGALREPSQLSGFLAALARNLATEHFRRVRRLPLENPDVLDGMEAPGRSPVDVISGRELAECVRRVLEELPVERDREVLRRFYLSSDDKDLICADFGLTRLQFNRVLHRARERFRELWASQEEPGEGTR